MLDKIIFDVAKFFILTQKFCFIYFSNQVPGRLYPIELQYMPISSAPLLQATVREEGRGKGRGVKQRGGGEKMR